MVEECDIGVNTNAEDIFWMMPPLLEELNPIVKPIPTTSYQRSDHVCCEQYFKTKKDLKVQLGLKCITEGYEYKVLKSNKSRFETRCLSDNCAWRMRATLCFDIDYWQVKKFNEEHTCPRTNVNPNHRQANPDVLCYLLKEQMKETKRIYRGKEIITDINKRFGISISYSQAWRGKCRALQILRGDLAELFTILPAYCHNLNHTNPGSVTEISVDQEGRFEMLFVAIGCAIRSFEYMRLVLIIDGAHLKGRFLGTMFIAVAMDGNNQILPIAYGVGKVESGETWAWFLTKLKEYIGPMPNGAIISDRAKTIDLAIQRVFLDVFHGLCCRHLSVNLNLKGSRNKGKRWLYWEACKAYRVSDFEQYMEKFHQILPVQGKTLDELSYEKWTRSHFPGNRFNCMTSNSAESMNVLSRYAQKLPITMLIDFFRSNLQMWYSRQTLAAKVNHTLTPWAEAKIRRRVTKSRTWTMSPAAIDEFVVHDSMRDGIVNITDRTCTCKKCQYPGLLCGHLLTAMREKGVNDCSQWTTTWFAMETYRKAFKLHVYVVGPPSKWVHPPQLLIVKPPLMVKRQSGRPPE